MEKQDILNEIKRTARENGGVACGVKRFFTLTGIKPSEWEGKYWVRWSDALQEAGFVPNEWGQGYDDNTLIASLVPFIRELGRFPLHREVKMRRRTVPSFASEGAFRRLGNKTKLLAMVLAHAKSHPGNEDIVEICNKEMVADKGAGSNDSLATVGPSAPNGDGSVYLLKAGRHYKIGKATSFGRRERQIALQLPEPADTVHVIRTDDPTGIEAYWHRRFEAKRANGEWFALDGSDVKAFKRRKFM